MTRALLQIDLNDKTTQWVLVCAGMLAFLYFFMRPKGKKRDPLAGSPRFSLAQQRQVEQQMQNLLVEFAEMARQMSAQLDTRAAKLELLIKEADQKLTQLASAVRPADPRPADPRPAEPPPAEADGDSDGPEGAGERGERRKKKREARRHQADAARADRGPRDGASDGSQGPEDSSGDDSPPPDRRRGQDRPQAFPPAAEATADAVSEVKPKTSPDARHGEVYALAEQGRSAEEIARQLHRHIGEVELILALRPK